MTLRVFNAAQRMSAMLQFYGCIETDQLRNYGMMRSLTWWYPSVFECIIIHGGPQLLQRKLIKKIEKKRKEKGKENIDEETGKDHS